MEGVWSVRGLWKEEVWTYQPAALESFSLSMRGVSRHGLSVGGEEVWDWVLWGRIGETVMVGGCRVVEVKRGPKMERGVVGSGPICTGEPSHRVKRRALDPTGDSCRFLAV